MQNTHQINAEYKGLCTQKVEGDGA